MDDDEKDAGLAARTAGLLRGAVLFLIGEFGYRRSLRRFR
jgi:hypothetical protein